ncbi:hypothetical protein HK11_07510 [Acetobacter sp. DmW_043]|nr:hypothetical protein HK11_07510 [Acetobacter sp. DmW_043]
MLSEGRFAARSLWRPLVYTTSGRVMITCTPEQTAVIARSPTESFKVVAGAGCGKTSTLVMFSTQWARYRGLYLAFNASIAREARGRFGRHVEARTAHAYAFAALNIGSLERSRLTGRYTTRHVRQLEKELGIKAPPGSAGIALQTLSAFLVSAGTKLTQAHCPEQDMARNRDIRTFVAEAFRYIMRYERHDFPITHDVYLKRFEMEGQITGYDYIMVDEAQDLNPVLFSILEKSGLPVVAAGDPHQSIFAFRGAVDAMSALHVPALPLSRSWRFGEPVAQLASRVLSCHSVPPRYPLHGNPAVKSAIHLYQGKIRPSHETLVMARTNIRLFESLALIDRPFHVLGGIQDMVQDIRAALSLYRQSIGAPPSQAGQGRLPFSSWAELLAAREGDTADPMARKLVTIIEKHGSDLDTKIGVIQSLHRDDPEEVSLICSTAHKAKGREFETVMMLDDFLSPAEWAQRREKLLARRFKLEEETTGSARARARKARDLTRRMEECDQEINLLYVACTRARQTLYLPEALYTFWRANS